MRKHLVLGFVLVLAACGKNDGSQTPVKDTVTLRELGFRVHDGQARVSGVLDGPSGEMEVFYYTGKLPTLASPIGGAKLTLKCLDGAACREIEITSPGQRLKLDGVVRTKVQAIQNAAVTVDPTRNPMPDNEMRWRRLITVGIDRKQSNCAQSTWKTKTYLACTIFGDQILADFGVPGHDGRMHYSIDDRQHGQFSTGYEKGELSRRADRMTLRFPGGTAELDLN
jgi:hypothetical protein